MANTVIQLKHSTLTGNVPSTLANGEISINNRDGKFFYSTPAGAIITHYPYTGPAGLNQEIQFNDSGSLGSDSGLTYNKTTDVLTVVGGAIVSGVNVVSQIQSSYNQANAAFAAANAGGSSTDSWARNQANAAFLQANTPSYVANSAAIYANGAFANSNTYITYAEAVSVTQNNSITAAFLAANAATATDTTQNNSITAAFIRANNSLDANNGGTVTGNVVVIGNVIATVLSTTGSNGTISGANAIFSNYVFAANGNVDLYIYSSKAYNHANAGFIRANATSDVANSAAIYANGAFAAANAITNVLYTYDLDDVSYLTDGFTNVFPLTYNTANVSVPSPWNLMVTIYGITQAAYANNYDTVWLSLVPTASKGYTLDDSGNIKFADSVPAGADVMIRLVPGIPNANTKIYPFKPTDIFMGY
jgi:hypothetical protein